MTEDNSQLYVLGRSQFLADFCLKRSAEVDLERSVDARNSRLSDVDTGRCGKGRGIRQLRVLKLPRYCCGVTSSRR